MKNNIPIFKCRASAIHQIMINARSKAETLSQTAKSYCELWLLEKLYNRKKDVKTDAMYKGTVNEIQSIEMINLAFDTNYQKYDGDMLENEYFTGTPDIFSDIIIDIKNANDFDTMPLFDSAPAINYYQQVQIYLDLTGLQRGAIIHTLTDMPEKLIEAKAWQLVKYEDMTYDDAYAYCMQIYTYFDVPEHLKIKRFDFERDENFIQSAKNRVIECREYINYLLNNL